MLHNIKNRLQRIFDGEQRYNLILPVKDGLRVVNISRIAYVKADGSYTHFYIAGNNDNDKPEIIMVSCCLGNYRHLLDNGFAQPNRSFIINLNYLEGFTRCNEIELKVEHPLIVITKDYALPFRNSLGLLPTVEE